VARATPDELNAVARLADPSQHDRASELALGRSLEEYIPRRREFVSRIEFSVDGAKRTNLYSALAEAERPFERLDLERVGPEPEGARWEFLRPFDRLTIGPDGGGELQRGGGPGQRVMARLLLREHYVPIPRPAGRGSAPIRSTARPELFTPATFARYIRITGIVPFAVALVAYFPEERVRYEVDLVDGALLLDPRTHRLLPTGRVGRSARFGHAVDVIVAWGELSLPSARALEVVVESNGLTAVELAPIFGGVRELASSALDSLVARRLVSFDRRTGLYRPRLDALVGPVERSRARPAPSGPRANPRLRSSVMELLAAAESRAACPLCGDPLPPDFKGLLCAKCQALVNAEGPAAPPA
jgi:hypothetical protein